MGRIFPVFDVTMKTLPWRSIALYNINTKVDSTEQGSLKDVVFVTSPSVSILEKSRKILAVPCLHILVFNRLGFIQLWSAANFQQKLPNSQVTYNLILLNAKLSMAKLCHLHQGD